MENNLVVHKLDSGVTIYYIADVNDEKTDKDIASMMGVITEHYQDTLVSNFNGDIDYDKDDERFVFFHNEQDANNALQFVINEVK